MKELSATDWHGLKGLLLLSCFRYPARETRDRLTLPCESVAKKLRDPIRYKPAVPFLTAEVLFKQPVKKRILDLTIYMVALSEVPFFLEPEFLK